MTQWSEIKFDLKKRFRQVMKQTIMWHSYIFPTLYLHTFSLKLFFVYVMTWMYDVRWRPCNCAEGKRKVEGDGGRVFKGGDYRRRHKTNEGRYVFELNSVFYVFPLESRGRCS